MGTYQEAFDGLNEAQKLAVTTTEGPVLVIAGPGTGKTQLLTTRIAHILKTTDTLPHNILCLTFTESAAHTMRERLSNMIGQDAYDVTISTYHAFGSDLLRRFPDYFTDLADMSPIDDLGIDRIFRTVMGGLAYNNPLRYVDVYLRDLKTFVSDAKRALLTPDDIRDIANTNLEFIRSANPEIATELQSVARVDKKSVTHFAALAGIITQYDNSLAKLMAQDLADALIKVEATGKTNSLTEWKNKWLAKGVNGQFVIDGLATNQKLLAAADIYQQYLSELAARGFFDYDDMILRAVRALETNDELRFTLQERYLYILLDEFQDTNGAQLRLVELLTDNPAAEGRPNVLAVGDDDQAIYAFQGANYSHMLQFQQLYQDVLLVPLTKNYRSHAGVLHTARGIAEQIEERLHHHFPQIEKTLTAENTKLPAKATIERLEARSDVEQFSWVALKIQELIKQGMSASEIAVLAPQHKYLEPLVSFLQEKRIPVRYEKREDVLDDPAINQLLRMSQLVIAMSQGKHALASSIWAEVLSFNFWRLPTSLIWKLSWQASDDHEQWTEVLLESPELKPIALFFIRLSQLADGETLETILDYLIGITPLDLQEPEHSGYKSPFYEYYFSDDGQSGFWELLSNLTVLRARLSEYLPEDRERLHIRDFINFVEAHRAAGIKVLNTSPHQESADSVQLMTAFKSKGMEFDAVFVLSVNDETWGNKAKVQSSRLSLPANLAHIRYAGANQDERLRLFYVALTRAKTHLYLVNYASNFAGKSLTRLKYLGETVEDNLGVSPLLPDGSQQIQATGQEAVSPTSELATYWQERHQSVLSREDVRALLGTRLERFQLSPTHVNCFVDLEHQGPGFFFINTILRFPQAPLPAGEFGNAIHETLEWIHIHNRNHGHLPSIEQVTVSYEQRLRSKHLSQRDIELYLDRGKHALTAYMAQRGHTIQAGNEAEFNFRSEGVFLDDAHLAGKIDKLIINKAEKTITIVDYKTGRPYLRWQHDAKLYRYQKQLYLYRALVEGSHTFEGYKVVDAYLEFVEPDGDGQIHELHLRFNEDEYDEAKKLAKAVWKRIKCVDLPDTSTYSPDLKGILAFEKDLLSDQLSAL